MAAEMINSRLVTERGVEVILIMDDYATEYLVTVPVTDSANRQAHIDEAIAQQSANQATLEAYAASHGIDLTAAKAAGLAKKQALKG